MTEWVRGFLQGLWGLLLPPPNPTRKAMHEPNGKWSAEMDAICACAGVRVVGETGDKVCGRTGHHGVGARGKRREELVRLASGGHGNDITRHTPASAQPHPPSQNGTAFTTGYGGRGGFQRAERQRAMTPAEKRATAYLISVGWWVLFIVALIFAVNGLH